jgi:hypothetical protein
MRRIAIAIMRHCTCRFPMPDVGWVVLRCAIWQCYGYHYLFTLFNLNKMGFLSPPATSSTKFYAALRKRLKLGEPYGSAASPTDFSFVYNQYVAIR